MQPFLSKVLNQRTVTGFKILQMQKKKKNPIPALYMQSNASMPAGYRVKNHFWIQASVTVTVCCDSVLKKKEKKWPRLAECTFPNNNYYLI